MWLSLAQMHKKAWWERKTHRKYFFLDYSRSGEKEDPSKIVYFRKDMREKKVESQKGRERRRDK